MQCVVCCVQCAVSSVQCAVFQCVVFSVQCAVCSVQYNVGTMFSDRNKAAVENGDQGKSSTAALNIRVKLKH